MTTYNPSEQAAIRRFVGEARSRGLTFEEAIAKLEDASAAEVVLGPFTDGGFNIRVIRVEEGYQLQLSGHEYTSWVDAMSPQVTGGSKAVEMLAKIAVSGVKGERAADLEVERLQRELAAVHERIGRIQTAMAELNGGT